MKHISIIGVVSLSAATLLLETTLTRLLAVAQFYHFAFLVVSLALLGFGASGTFLSLKPKWLTKLSIEQVQAASGGGFALSTAVAYLAVNYLPFDSYRIAWEWQQILYFFLYYLALGLPFLCSGVGIGASLVESTGHSHLTYAANLIGSAAGVLLAPAILSTAGVTGALLFSGLIGLLPSTILPPSQRMGNLSRKWSVILISLTGLAWWITLAVVNLQARSPLGITLSPYKGLPQALLHSTSTPIYGRWNAISRVDVIANANLHTMPGLSYTYPGVLPPQLALFIDADAPYPITLVKPEDFDAAGYMPEAFAFKLRPEADILVLEPGGGLGVLQALANQVGTVTAVISNPLIPRAAALTAGNLDVFTSPHVHLVIENSRVFLRQGQQKYGIIYMPLTDSYRPVTNGAYSLSETYSLTVEAFADMLSRLAPDGILVITRWLQTPPSEDLRLVTTMVEAMVKQGISSPADHLIAYRGIQTLTVLVQPGRWSPAELADLRLFASERRYDLVWAPDIRVDEVNLYNRLPSPVYYDAVHALLTTTDRRAFYASYPYDITPPSDNHPFFFHFFTWQQTPQILRSLGHTWQPFGGSGYFILVALLALVLLLSAGLVAAPLVFTIRQRAPFSVLVYFALLGIAYLFVEIPLIQRWILLLGHPTYAFTAVVLALLLFSSLGSLLARSRWMGRRSSIGLLVIITLLTPATASAIINLSLGLPQGLRMVSAVLSLAPLGLLMGLPFPLGLAWLEKKAPHLIPWAWAVNGCASVVASVLSALLSLSFGFNAVLLLGAVAYGGAFLVFNVNPK